jgi:hypothetical protein
MVMKWLKSVRIIIPTKWRLSLAEIYRLNCSESWRSRDMGCFRRETAIHRENVP